MAANTQVAILKRVFESELSDIAPAAAGYILGLRFHSVDVGRMNVLAVKGQEGALSRAERDELDAYRRVGDVLAMVQAKARRSLRKTERPEAR